MKKLLHYGNFFLLCIVISALYMLFFLSYSQATLLKVTITPNENSSILQEPVALIDTTEGPGITYPLFEVIQQKKSIIKLLPSIFTAFAKQSQTILTETDISIQIAFAKEIFSNQQQGSIGDNIEIDCAVKDELGVSKSIGTFGYKNEKIYKVDALQRKTYLPGNSYETTLNADNVFKGTTVAIVCKSSADEQYAIQSKKQAIQANGRESQFANAEDYGLTIDNINLTSRPIGTGYSLVSRDLNHRSPDTIEQILCSLSTLDFAPVNIQTTSLANNISQQQGRSPTRQQTANQDIGRMNKFTFTIDTNYFSGSTIVSTDELGEQITLQCGSNPTIQKTIQAQNGNDSSNNTTISEDANEDEMSYTIRNVTIFGEGSDQSALVDIIIGFGTNFFSAESFSTVKCQIKHTENTNDFLILTGKKMEGTATIDILQTIGDTTNTLIGTNTVRSLVTISDNSIQNNPDALQDSLQVECKLNDQSTINNSNAEKKLDKPINIIEGVNRIKLQNPISPKNSSSIKTGGLFAIPTYTDNNFHSYSAQ